MGNLGKAVKKGVDAFWDSMQPAEYEACGKQVVCLHCGGARFAEGTATLGDAGIVGLGGSYEAVSTLACTACGYIQWFLKRPQRRQKQDG